MTCAELYHLCYFLCKLVPQDVREVFLQYPDGHSTQPLAFINGVSPSVLANMYCRMFKKFCHNIKIAYSHSVHKWFKTSIDTITTYIDSINIHLRLMKISSHNIKMAMSCLTAHCSGV